jgi:uncharacterized membrane protein YsdA (DUF1294 family)
MICYFVYLGIMTVGTFFIYFSDKKRAVEKRRRISEKALLILSFLGGALGGFVAMYVFKHKTSVWYFSVVNILSIALHAALSIFLTVYLEVAF